MHSLINGNLVFTIRYMLGEGFCVMHRTGIWFSLSSSCVLSVLAKPRVMHSERSVWEEAIPS
jgi:hypothetical protein